MPTEPQRADLVRDGARAETGVVQFDGDWPGVFLRGDDAMGYAMQLRATVQRLRDKKDADCSVIAAFLEKMADLFASSWQDH